MYQNEMQARIAQEAGDNVEARRFLEAMMPFTQWAIAQGMGTYLSLISCVETIVGVHENELLFSPLADIQLPDVWAWERAAVTLCEMARRAGLVNAVRVCEQTLHEARLAIDAAVTTLFF